MAVLVQAELVRRVVDLAGTDHLMVEKPLGRVVEVPLEQLALQPVAQGLTGRDEEELVGLGLLCYAVVHTDIVVGVD